MAKKPILGEGNHLLSEEEMDAYRHISHKIPTYGGSKSNLFENSSLVSVKILIDGKEFFNGSHIKLEIKQSVYDKHSFELICDPDEFEENKAYLLENSRKVLGNRISFLFYQFGKVQQLFTGIVSRVVTRKVEGVRNIVLLGSCPSVLMENGLHCESFVDMDFNGIISSIGGRYPQNLVQFQINPNLKEKISYISQYNESDYHFLRRLSSQFGEYFYYNGEQFVFSAWGSKIVDMMEGEDIYDFELGMEMGKQNFSYVGYDPQQGEELNFSSSDLNIQKSVNPFQVYADNVSEGLYNQVAPTGHYGHSNLQGGRREMERELERGLKGNQELVFLRAKGNNPALRVGDVAKLFVWMPGHSIFKNGRVPGESYKVVEIIHRFVDGDGYVQEFKGVPKDSEVPESYNVMAFPKAEVQHAKVMDNRDPKAMGRVRVQFAWQKAKNSQTPWVQVIQPHAGKGKGTYFAPEIGEMVLVAFQGGNPDAPVVLGTAYNGGEIAEYYTQGNDLKVIQTRSGTRIVFNDAEGKGSILVEDPSGNRWFMDGKGNISVDAPKDMNFTAGENFNVSVGKNITMQAGINMSSYAGNDIIQRAAGEIEETSDRRTEIAEKELSRKSESMNSQADSIQAISEKENLLLQSGKTVFSNSSEKSNLF